MAASVVEDWQSSKTMMQCNHYMWSNQIACDIQFLVGEYEESIPAHKYVLMSRSCVFFTMFCGPLAETRDSIQLPDIEPQVFKSLLEYLYTDHCDLQPDLVLPLLYAAKKYAIQTLVKRCIQFLEVDLMADNICTVLEQSYLYDENDLKDKCMTYISDHAREVMESPDFLTLSNTCVKIILSSDELQIDEKTVLNCMMKWANKQCEDKGLGKCAENQRKVLGELLYLIRFPLLGDEYFTEVVADMEILNDTEKVELFKYFFKRGDKKCCFNFTHRFASASSVMTASFHSDTSDTRPIQTCMRYQTVYEDGSWYCGGEPDAVSFTCNEKITLHGVLVYGSYIGEGVYDVTCSIYDTTDRELGLRKTRLKTSESQHTYPVLLEQPIDIGPGKKHSLVVKLTSSEGLDTYQGKNGLSSVTANGVRFNFSKSRYSRNGTDVKIGQIPGLLFTSNGRKREEYDSA